MGVILPDPDLVNLPAPPRTLRMLSLVLACVTLLAALATAGALAGEAGYALQQDAPRDVGKLAELSPSPALINRYVRGQGSIEVGRGLRFARPFDGAMYRLAPVLHNPQIWVEMRLAPDEPLDLPAPTAFVGRLVPLAGERFRHRGLNAVMKRALGYELPVDTWILLDGTVPRSCTYALGLLALLAGFGGYSAWSIVRILRRFDR